MPSIRRQEAKARRSREMDMLDVLLGSENVNPIERELANIINGSISNNDTEAFSQQRRNSSQRMK